MIYSSEINLTRLQRGSSSYIHYKYSDDGSTFTTNNGETPGKYTGILVDNNEQDSMVFGDYSWAKTSGEDGATGKGVSSIVDEYYLSTSKTSLQDGSWSSLKPTKFDASKYLWTRLKCTYDDSPATVSYTTPTLDLGWGSAQEVDAKVTTLQTDLNIEQGKLAALIKQTDTDRKNTSDKFTQVTADINGINTTIGSVQTKVDNMKVGGRNYWIQSAFDADTYKVTNTKPSGSRVPGWYADLKAVIVSDPDGNYCKLKPATIWHCAQYFNFTDGEKWTISFEARAATDNLVGKNVAINTDLLNIHPYPIGALSKDWKKYSLTFDAVGTGEERVHIRCLTGTGTDNDELHIRKIKLEKGTVATDWTPAPEDTDAQFTTINSQITTINATAAGLETKVTKAQNDATAAQSKATQAADKIGLVVQSGTNQSNLVLTPGALSAIADNINLTGKVTFTSLDTSTQNKINKTIASTSTEYANSTSQTTQPASGWSTTMPAKETGKVIWSRKKVVYVDGTSAYQDYAPISGLNGKDGKDGTNGTNGKDGANGADAITLSITSSAGISFKGTQTVTTLTCHVFRGGKELTTTEISSLGTIRWYKDTGTTSVGTGATYTVAAGTVTSATSYTAKLEG